MAPKPLAVVIPVPDVQLRTTRSGRVVKAPGRYSPECPHGGFVDDFTEDEYEEHVFGSVGTHGSDSEDPNEVSNSDPDYVEGETTDEEIRNRNRKRKRR
jgi:hypothetical protein